MYETVSFNIYKEHLENIVYAERENGIKQDNRQKKRKINRFRNRRRDWTDSVNYRSSNRESESTNNN